MLDEAIDICNNYQQAIEFIKKNREEEKKVCDGIIASQKEVIEVQNEIIETQNDLIEHLKQKVYSLEEKLKEI